MSEPGSTVAPMIEIAPSREWSLVVHGGASGVLVDERREALTAGIEAAFRAGEAVLSEGGSAADAVVAAVLVLEDDPWFNAGRGAALTSLGTAEHDACLMTGDGTAGAVMASKFARNPILAARAVKEQTIHAGIVDPPIEMLDAWGVETAPREYFVTELRKTQLARRQAENSEGRSGTVGAVARDIHGNLAAGTSTGGLENQTIGRVGDSPIVGAGTYAKDGVVAVSCTGEGEAFLQGCVSHEISARMRYAGERLAEAAQNTIDAEVTGRGAFGGLIAIDGDGTVVVAQNTPMLVSAWRDGDEIVSKL